jgi:4'-phosphopantetheinyl transferase
MRRALAVSVNAITGWCEKSEVPPLGQFEIHVWRIGLVWPEAVKNRLKLCLTDEEIHRAASYHFARDQGRFVVRRAILRRLLASYLGMRAEVIRLLPGPNGKPFVSGQDVPGGIRFNCSHSADRGLIVIARGCGLGADLEQHRHLSDAEDLAKAFFSDSEIKELNDLPESLKTVGFFNCWTRKEAFVKALGLGLSFPLNRFSVSLMPGQPAALLDVAEDHGAIKKWTMASLDVGVDYSAALVFEGRNVKFQYFEWSPRLLDLPTQT